MTFNGSGLGFSIQMRRDSPDHFNRAHAMRNRHDCIAINAFPRSPLPPFAVHLPRGVHKHSIQIKKYG